MYNLKSFFKKTFDAEGDYIAQFSSEQAKDKESDYSTKGARLSEQKNSPIKVFDNNKIIINHSNKHKVLLNLVEINKNNKINNNQEIKESHKLNQDKINKVKMILVLIKQKKQNQILQLKKLKKT